MGSRGQKWIYENLDYQNLIPKLEMHLKELVNEKV
jgi:hypothetical protein